MGAVRERGDEQLGELGVVVARALASADPLRQLVVGVARVR
jgi:hypothetical protein